MTFIHAWHVPALQTAWPITGEQNVQGKARALEVGLH